MNRLNPTAFEFVPGKGFKIDDQVQQQPQLPPVERPEQTEAPPPAPTISLNIGGSKPTPGSSAPSTSNQSIPPASVKHPGPKPQTKSTLPSTPPSKTFSTEKAKTDTAAIALEVQAVADRAVLEDLYGDGQCDVHSYLTANFLTLVIYTQSQGAS
jgi:peptide chain release factor subunit 3